MSVPALQTAHIIACGSGLYKLLPLFIGGLFVGSYTRRVALSERVRAYALALRTHLSPLLDSVCASAFPSPCVAAAVRLACRQRCKARRIRAPLLGAVCVGPCYATCVARRRQRGSVFMPAPRPSAGIIHGNKQALQRLPSVRGAIMLASVGSGSLQQQDIIDTPQPYRRVYVQRCGRITQHNATSHALAADLPRPARQRQQQILYTPPRPRGVYNRCV